MTFRRVGSAVAVAAVAAALALPAAPPAVAAPVAHSQLVSTVPSAATPHASDGKVGAIVQIGSTVVIGGTFSTVKSPDRQTSYARSRLASFSVDTGEVTAFAPVLDDAVEALVPGPVAGTVLVAGRFANVNGVPARALVLLDLATGQRVAGWNPPVFDGDILSLESSGSRLFAGGSFRTVGGLVRKGLVSMTLSTGAVDGYLTSSVEVNHNWTPTSGTAKAPVGVARLDVSPDGQKLVAIGNFKKVDGLDRDQVAMWNLGSTAVLRADWRTRGFEHECLKATFDYHVRDVDFSPDGSYFVVAASGGAYGLCDAATRWETAATGDAVLPTWHAATGGDTLLSVAVTGAAVYVGGHQRWLNNPSKGNVAGPGAVPRPGIASLDPLTGLPLGWNPGRNPRGAGAAALYVTDQGLWVGHDTAYIGNMEFRREGVAFFPLAGGRAVASSARPALPGSVYLGSRTTTSTVPVASRVNAGGHPQQTLDSGIDWSGDTNAAPSPRRTNGSNVSTYATPAIRDDTIPATTPAMMLQTARWDSGTKGDGSEMQWNIPVPAGMPIEVRLYFVARALDPGTRVFDVSVDGRRIDDFDATAELGYAVATMRSFRYISDGNVDIDFFHEIGDPFVNGIEIVKTASATPSVDNVLRSRTYTGSTVGPAVVESSPIDWRQVRGTAMIGGYLYYGTTDSRLHRLTFDGTTFGPDSLVDPYNDPVWSDVLTGAGQTYRGVPPSFYLEIGDITSMWFDGRGRLYYTLFKQSGLHYRGFTPDSGVISHARRTLPGVTMPDITGAFLSGSTLHYVTRADGKLWKVGFSSTGTLVGTATAVSGPAIDGVDWRSRSLFLGPS